jgi:chemotaxis protein MotB
MNDTPKNEQPETTGPRENDFGNNGGNRTIDIVPRQNQRFLTAALVILIGGIAALGFYTVKTKGKLDKTATAVEEADQKLVDSQKDLKRVTAECDAEKAKTKDEQELLAGQVRELETALKNTETAVVELKDENQQNAEELAQFKKFSSQFKRMTDAGKLEVVFRRGRMVVTLPAQVLFDSGSADLSQEGQTALKDVADVLRTVKNKRFMVGGHTDDQQIKKAKFDSNWDLSSARALTVTKALIKAGLKPWNLVAAGYSQFAPVASNKSEAGRQKNRRIEIILEPNLKDIEPPKAKSPSDVKKGKSGKKSK